MASNSALAGVDGSLHVTPPNNSGLPLTTLASPSEKSSETLGRANELVGQATSAASLPPVFADTSHEDSLLARPKSKNSSERRRSGRARVATKLYVPENVQTRKRPPKQMGSKIAKRQNEKQKPPSMIVKLHYKNVAPTPTFHKIELNCSLEVFWLRVNLREFLLRFDKLCRLPTRHAAVINDPLQEWNDYLYKAAMVAMLRLIANHDIPIIANARDYLNEVEHQPADSHEIWACLIGMLKTHDLKAEHALIDLNGEHLKLELMRRLMVLATGTETIRLTITSDWEQLRYIQQETADVIKKHQAHWQETKARLAKLKSIGREVWESKQALAHKTMTDRVFRAEQLIFHQMRKYNLRTVPLGTDNRRNTYWSLQQKSKDIPSWGSWIICEMHHPFEADLDTGKLVAEMFQRREERKERAKARAQAKSKEKQEAAAAVAAAPAVAEAVVGDSNTQATTEAQPHVALETKPMPRLVLKPPKKEDGESESPANGEKKPPSKCKEPRSRRLVIKHPKAETTLYYVSAKEDMRALASWIRSQAGPRCDKLCEEIEALAYYSYN